MTDFPKTAERVWQMLRALQVGEGRRTWPVHQVLHICDRPFDFFYKIESGLVWRSVETDTWKIHCIEPVSRTASGRGFGGWLLVRGTETDFQKDVVLIVLATSTT